MCGICGVRAAGQPTDEDRRIVERMSGALAHRGPDGAGACVSGTAVFGHRRLAVIDVEGGQQPLFNEDSSVAVVFNGEIYNYRELRATLIAGGHRFRTNADTEVLVHGYEQWGEAMLDRLRGMFAFALSDERTGRLLLVRDRLGVKSLYWYRAPGGRLVFASEIKALFADLSVPRALNHARLAEYLAFRSVSGEATLFDGIRELEPGTVVRVAADGELTSRRFWSAESDATQEAGDRISEGRNLLQDAVRSRMVSDVPLGTITSGGLDSSLISAIAAELTPEPIDTFCVGFDDARYDERPHARAVASAIGSRHHEVVAGPSDILRELPRLTWAHDEPVTHPNSIPMHLVFRYAKEEAGVTVLLSGEGADEVFGGYDWYRTAMRRERLRGLARFHRLLRAAPLRRLRTLGRVLGPDYLTSANAFSEPGAEVRSLWPDAVPGADRSLLWPHSRTGADGLFIYDQRTYLPPLLQRQDRMSMAAGLEARVPFLDHALVEWANSLPAAVKLSGGEPKQLLKGVGAKWLPESITHREKVGFAMPLGAWLRPTGALAPLLEPIRAADAHVREFLDGRTVDRLLAEHSSGARDHADMLWMLSSLENWCTVFLGPGGVESHALPGAATGRPALATPVLQ